MTITIEITDTADGEGLYHAHVKDMDHFGGCGTTKSRALRNLLPALRVASGLLTNEEFIGYGEDRRKAFIAGIVYGMNRS